MPKPAANADFFWPLALLAVAVMALLFGGVVALTQAFDRSEKRHEETMIQSGLLARQEEVARLVVPQAVWDDALLNLAIRPDRAWATDNIGKFLHQAQGFEQAFVLDSQDRPIFAFGQGKAQPLSSYDPLADATADLVANVRRQEARRRQAATSELNSAIHAVGIGRVDGLAYIVTVTLVAPDFGKLGAAPKHSSIVVATRLLDTTFTDEFGGRYILRQPHIHEADSSAEPGEAHAVLADSRGRPVATMDWLPSQPGKALRDQIILPLLAVLATLGGMALWLFRRSHRMAQGLIASEARAAHLAYYDPLTGLPNRVLFADRLGLALQQARRSVDPVAIHIIDLDRFKEVNDTFGHHVGDELIVEAARRMAGQCRAADTFARLSGDEFAIIQPGADGASAAALASRLIREMAEPVDLGAGRLFVGCSIGIALADGHESEPAEAMRQADLALYRAKDQGRGQFALFEIEMDAAIKMRRALEADLREAMAAGDLKMVYQPQVDRNGTMTGVEALVRWTHPVRGPVSPALFVPIAEECGLIVDLGFFTLRQAFNDSRRWRRLKVGINVSAAQLRMKDFLSRLSDLITETGADPKQYELEITEGLLLGDDPVIHETLRSLRQMGFGLALDDFGTGFSSLSYLQRFPISKIKIDRSFVANLGVDDEAEAVVSAIVKLARALKLGVIAEGVETSDQRRRLAHAGCSEIQGFLFSRPVPPEEIDGRSEMRLTAQAA